MCSGYWTIRFSLDDTYNHKNDAHIIPIFKKGDKEFKSNYRPVSVLPNMSTIFERIIFRQISNYMKSFLSKYQCGFRKGYSTQHCL